MNIELLNQVLHDSALNTIDRHFARFMEKLSGGENPELALAAAIVSHHCGLGNICVHLLSLAGKEFSPSTEDGPTIRCPQWKEWLRILSASSVVGRPGEFKPLILDDANRLYLHRYWEYEAQLAQMILERANANSPDVDWDLARNGFARLFPKSQSGETDWQKVAAFAALRKKFCIISGGPGTGKTHTVALILALLIEQAGQTKLRIKLCAPTGKAAARLQESLQRVKTGLNCDARVKAQLPEEASTIHRLLGFVPDSAEFRHNAENQLAADVVIVDEASMVGLSLMAKLVAAVPTNARLILLGDKDQLASVEAGAVLGDICNAGFERELSREFRTDYEKIVGDKTNAGREDARPTGTTNGELADCIVELRKNYRFGESGHLSQLSQAINRGDADGALAVLNRRSAGGSLPCSIHDDQTGGRAARAPGSVSWRQLPKASGLKSELKPMVLEHFGPCFDGNNAEAILRRLEKFRILCAVRQGAYGVGTMNQAVEEILREAGFIKTDADWYAGRPVMITRNDYNLKLFNGDIGVALPDENGALRVFFRGEDNTIRPVSHLRLPEHETVFAMTVHKSQGSEFENVLLILPDCESKVLTRELIYTGLTRASRSVQLWLREEIFRAAIARRVERTSGLRDALWND